MTSLRLFLAAAALAAPSLASALGVAEVRGDFYYDEHGTLVGMKHVDAPATDVREPMSHKQRFQEAGLRLPVAAGPLEPREPRAKAAVVAHEQSRLDRVFVKFAEGPKVRLRDGRLTANGAAMPAVTAALAAYPVASVRRMFDLDERILEENKETGERLSGRELADLNHWFVVELSAATPRAVDLANALLALDVVETAYLDTEPAPPPVCADVAPTTPLWEGSQNYLQAAPAGIDAYHAWSYHPGGNGPGTSFWVMDLEYNWCLTHEDLEVDAADVVTGSTVGPFDDPDHGTAVLGIYGACDNAYGMTGATPDITMKLLDTHTHGVNHAVCVAEAAARLLPGEVMLIEQQVSGPSGEFLPVEWVSATWDAIQTATANGIIVVEAAGNGGSNLDAAAYGGWFGTGHDSGAILVGAAEQGTHSPRASTNYGATVDAHGYGVSVYSTGYGTIFSSGSTCSQDYTSGFNGTSSASPMVTAAAVALQGIANAKYGIDLSPAQVREALRVGGTPQGAPAGNNIGPMPNLVNAINWIEPDMRPATAHAGWTYSVVPRAVNTSSPGSAPLDAPAIAGDAAATYWNAVVENSPVVWTSTVNEPDDRIYVDDQWVVQGLRPDHPPGGASYLVNFGPLTVRAGRHTIRHFVDFDDVEEEWVETNNEYLRQFIWSAPSLTANMESVRDPGAFATSQGWGPWYNAEGLRGNTGTPYWYAFAVLPHVSTSDYDIRLNTEAPANIPQAGFGANVASSFTGPGEIAFVGLNRNNAPAGSYWASVLNFTSFAGGQETVVFAADLGTLSGTGSFGPFTLASGEVLNLHELSLAGGSQYRVHVEWLSGGADYGLSVFGPAQTYFDKATAVASANANGAATDEFVILDVPASDFHGVAVWKARSADRTQSLSYRLHVSTLPNLVTSATPSGWWGPIVPRNSTDATSGSCTLPAVLVGNTPTTSFNWATLNEGANSTGTGWQTNLVVDDDYGWVGFGGILPAGQFLRILNTAQGLIPFSVVAGGRHHLRTIADQLGALAEFDEADNAFTDWFVWTPLVLANDLPQTLPAPPVRNPTGYGPHYSVDGFRTTRTTYWTAVGATPVAATDDYDVTLYPMSTGSRDGFGASIAWSGSIGSFTDFVLVNYNVAPGTDMDVGLMNWGGAGNVVLQQSNAPYEGTVGAGVTTLGPYALGAGAVLAVHEVYVDASVVGQPLYASLHHVAGAGDLDVAFFDGSAGTMSKWDATSLGGTDAAAADEHLPSWTPTAEGFVAFVVFKHDATDLPSACTYRLVLSSGASVVDAPEIAGAPDRFALAVPRPNPFGSDTVIRYDVPADGGALSIDVFDLGGRRVANLVRGAQPAGRHAARWDGRDASGRRVTAGVYFVRLTGAAVDETRKVTLLR